jgi:hypothetical protein
VDARADIFSLGVVFWEMLTGKRLFRRESDAATLRAALRDEIPCPSSIRGEVPHELDIIVMRALERQLPQRYATANEMSQALGLLLPRKHEHDNGPLCVLMNSLFRDELEEQRGLVLGLRSTSVTMLGQSLPAAPELHGTSTASSSVVSMEVSQIDTLVHAMERRSRAMYRMMATALVAALLLLLLFAILFFRSNGAAQSRAPREIIPPRTWPAKNSSLAAAQPSQESVIARNEQHGAVPATLSTLEVRKPITHRRNLIRAVGRAIPTSTSLGNASKGTSFPETAADIGYLTIDTTPWSIVSLNGQVLGQTPLIGVRLPIGTQYLMLRNPDSETITRYAVTIEAGKTTSRRIGLD